ncbi:MAG: Asp-tRNA(Asn)/Glu-tRNA(Gln) amidotransferase subunit GatC [Candidatus Pacebacteria bacterium]|nr:Asp-tRNA(Asn)/Glu-tRNA(Gln) amidotransferase subunit GatC [Candidatus Paceibacterota bacterium]
MSDDAKISEEQVLHLAKLAQLELTEEEVAKFSVQLSDILQYIDKVKDVELSDNVQRDFKNLNTFREDENPHKAGEHREDILEAMPKTQDDLLVVKKILNN